MLEAILLFFWQIWIPEDKLYHIIVGIILFIGIKFNPVIKIKNNINILIIFIIAVVKEIRDYPLPNSNADFYDIIATIIIPIIILIIIKLKNNGKCIKNNSSNNISTDTMNKS